MMYLKNGDKEQRKAAGIQNKYDKITIIIQILHYKHVRPAYRFCSEFVIQIILVIQYINIS